MLAAMTWWASLRTHAPVVIFHSSPLGLSAALVWISGPFILPLLAFVQAPLQAIKTLFDLGVLLWLVNGALLWGGATWLAVRFAWRLPTASARRLARLLSIAMLPITTVALAYLAHYLPFLRTLFLLIPLTGLFTAGLLMGDDETTSVGRTQWRKVAGYAALVIAHSFPLQLVLQLPPLGWTPALGTVWTLAEAPHATAALGAALLLFGAWAGLCAWMVDSHPREASLLDVFHGEHESKV
jgi:hypothetical protein